jgi:hypothetical protein
MTQRSDALHQAFARDGEARPGGRRFDVVEFRRADYLRVDEIFRLLCAAPVQVT